LHSATLLPREALCVCCKINTAIVLKDGDIAPLRLLRSVAVTRGCLCQVRVRDPRGEWFYVETRRTRRTGVSTSPLTSCWVCCLVYPYHAETQYQLIGFLKQHFSNYPKLIRVSVCNDAKIKTKDIIVSTLAREEEKPGTFNKT
jgi:hypothetical protein